MYRWSVYAGAAETKRVWEFSVHLSKVVLVGFAFCSGFFNLFRLFNTVTAIFLVFFYVCIFLLIPLNIIWHNLSLLELIFFLSFNESQYLLEFYFTIIVCCRKHYFQKKNIPNTSSLQNSLAYTNNVTLTVNNKRYWNGSQMTSTK